MRKKLNTDNNSENRTWHCQSYTVTVKIQEIDEYGIPPSEYAETRYRVVDDETGKILDDAQGYGYTTRQKAFLAYNWKLNRKKKNYKNKSC